jgi:hypothetical protein
VAIHFTITYLATTPLDGFIGILEYGWIKNVILEKTKVSFTMENILYLY